MFIYIFFFFFFFFLLLLLLIIIISRCGPKPRLGPDVLVLIVIVRLSF